MKTDEGSELEIQFALDKGTVNIEQSNGVENVEGICGDVQPHPIFVTPPWRKHIS